MRQNQNYQYSFDEKKIIVTKSFLKEAGKIGSVAYMTLVQVRRDFPDFQIVPREIAKKSGKQTYGKLTFKRMAEFIQAFEEDNAAAVMAEFERVKVLSKAYKGQYAYVKKWFLESYKEVFKNEEPEEDAA